MTKKRILIVEHQGITAMDEAHIMRDLGYEVTGRARSGEAALEQAGSDRPDVVLMDIMLPSGKDSLEAATKIYELYQIPVVFVAAFGDKKSSKAGTLNVPEGIGYIVKPYTKEELKSEIERLTYIRDVIRCGGG